jgi:hypothetical protein
LEIVPQEVAVCAKLLHWQQGLQLLQDAEDAALEMDVIACSSRETVATWRWGNTTKDGWMNGKITIKTMDYIVTEFLGIQTTYSL